MQNILIPSPRFVATVGFLLAASIAHAAPTVSITSPASNTVYGAPATVVINATATPSAGTTIKQVAFYRGTTLIATDTTAPYSVTWSNAPAGSYSLTAKATDNKNKTTTSTAVAIVVNAPPTVSLTSPTANQTFSAPATVTLSATAADSDGTVSKVEFYQGTTLIGTATTAPYTVTWSNAPSGSYSLTAKATDNRGTTTTSAAIPITVSSNASPTVSLTSPAANTVFGAPATVTLTATAADSDGTVAKVEFYQGATLIGTATTAPYTVTWSNAPAGSYSLTAKATDNSGAATTSTAVPIVVNASPTVTLTSPAANTVFGAPATIALTASAADNDGTVAKVEFYQGATLIGTATTAPYTVTWSNAPAGSYSLTAKATDSHGAVTTSTAIPITINANASPTVSLTSPAANQTFSAPATVTLTATAADSDGTVAKVEFYQGTTLIGTATTAPYTVTWSNAPAGNYNLTAKATDNQGVATTSAAVSIVVNALPTVTLTSPAANETFAAPATVTLTATAADSDGSVAKVDFYQGSTLIGTATTAPYAVTWSNVPAGSYSLTAKATDSQGAVTTSAAIPITINANASPTVTLTGPTANTIFGAPATIALTATAADSDGTVSQVEFYQGTTLIGTATSAPYTVTWSNAPAGSYSLTAKATDNQGAVTTSAAVPITVNANTPPTVTLTSPTANQTFSAPATVTLTATAADSDGTVASVEFYQGATLIGTATTTPYTVTWSNAPAGTYSLTAKAVDNQGATTTSAAVPITVTGGAASVYYLYTDHLNTPRLVTNESNGVIWRSLPLVEPFGLAPAEDDPDGNGVPFAMNLRFPGQYADKETNLNYNYYRDYNPQTGRYIQSDPIGLQGGVNTYIYVEGNPLSKIDPLGLNPLLAGMSGVAATSSGGLLGSLFGGKSGQSQSSASGTGNAALDAGLGGKANASSCPPPNDCDKLNDDVQKAKSRVGSMQPAAGFAGMSRWQLEQRHSAWLDLATARAKRDQKCWAGVDEGHQQAQGDAWSHVGRCAGLLK